MDAQLRQAEGNDPLDSGDEQEADLQPLMQREPTSREESASLAISQSATDSAAGSVSQSVGNHIELEDSGLEHASEGSKGDAKQAADCQPLVQHEPPSCDEGASSAISQRGPNSPAGSVSQNVGNEVGPVAGEAHAVGSEEWRRMNARRAANARHDQPGGNRDKHRKIRQSFASGQYPTRDACAEKVCAALGMAFSTARKALVNTPDPVRKCEPSKG